MRSVADIWTFTIFHRNYQTRSLFFVNRKSFVNRQILRSSHRLLQLSSYFKFEFTWVILERLLSSPECNICSEYSLHSPLHLCKYPVNTETYVSIYYLITLAHKMRQSSLTKIIKISYIMNSERVNINQTSTNYSSPENS